MGNYIQIEIGGLQRGLKFNQMADTEYRVKVGDQTNPIAHTYSLVWAGLITNCFVKCEEFVNKVEKVIDGKNVIVDVPITFEDVCEWCEKVSDDDFMKVLESYKSTKAFLTDVPEEVKKKIVRKSVQKNIKLNALK